MFQLIAYIKFLLKSTNEHGVHSPFVFDLVTKCFYNKKKLPAYIKIKHYREELLSNNNTIEVTDFGAGSRVFKSNTRQIAAIAKTAGITPKRAQLLARITQYFNCTSALELGTSLGLATAAMAYGNPITSITTLEGCPATASIAKKMFYKHQLNTITAVTTNFSDYLQQLATNYSLVYFDGNHQKEATLNYFETLVQYSSNDTVFIFDDIHWSKKMETAWESIKKHPKVTITIDTFYWGFVFFRSENKHKEHFSIRV